MARGGRIDNELLLKAGLQLMRQAGKNLEKLPSQGRSMLYELENGASVRVRTCNDHVLIAVADKPTKNAKLNIEGTDWLLIVMPVEPRTHGDVRAYLVPTKEAVEAVREAHHSWLATNPNTKGDNTTWNLWFGARGKRQSNNFAEKWADYLLPGTVSTDELVEGSSPPISSAAVDVKSVVRAAQLRIAEAAGVAPESVKISVDFG